MLYSVFNGSWPFGVGSGQVMLDGLLMNMGGPCGHRKADTRGAAGAPAHAGGAGGSRRRDQGVYLAPGAEQELGVAGDARGGAGSARRALEHLFLDRRAPAVRVREGRADAAGRSGVRQVRAADSRLDHDGDGAVPAGARARTAVRVRTRRTTARSSATSFAAACPSTWGAGRPSRRRENRSATRRSRNIRSETWAGRRPRCCS